MKAVKPAKTNTPEPSNKADTSKAAAGTKRRAPKGKAKAKGRKLKEAEVEEEQEEEEEEPPRKVPKKSKRK